MRKDLINKLYQAATAQPQAEIKITQITREEKETKIKEFLIKWLADQTPEDLQCILDEVSLLRKTKQTGCA